MKRAESQDGILAAFFRRRPGLAQRRRCSPAAWSGWWAFSFFPWLTFWPSALPAARLTGRLNGRWGSPITGRAFQPLYLGVYWRSFWMAVLTTVLCMLLGYPGGLHLALKFPGGGNPRC